MYFKNICKKKKTKKKTVYVADIFKSFDMHKVMVFKNKKNIYIICIEGINSIAKDFIRVQTEQAL